MPLVLIIEDESAIVEALSFALTREGFKVETVGLAKDAVLKIKDTVPNLVLLDIGLPDANGFDVYREIRQLCDVPIVFLTARNDEIDRILGLELGADDYIVKPFSTREVVARVRTILRRTLKVDKNSGFASSRERSKASLFVVDEEKNRIDYCHERLELTRYEYALLKTLLCHPERVYSRKELMDLVWNNAIESSDRTVDTHIKVLRSKLRTISLEYDPIVTHRGMGYSIDPYP